VNFDVVLLVVMVLMAGLSTGCAWAAANSADRARREADALRTSRGRIIALEHSVEVLDQRVKRAVGTAYEARSRARASARATTLEDEFFTGTPADGEPDDSELTALLSMQKAPPVKPGA